MKCNRLGCINKSIGSGRCAAHGGTKNNTTHTRIRPEYDKLYNTAWWRKTRVSYLQHHPLCCRCSSLGYTSEAIDVDHIRSHKGNKKLFYDKSNLQGLCRSCHSWKTQRERHAAWSDLDFSSYK